LNLPGLPYQFALALFHPKNLKNDIPLAWRLENSKRLSDFRRVSAAIHRSQNYKIRKANQSANPVDLKGWTSLVEERIEAARVLGHFKNLKGRGKPLVLSEEERNPFISREEFFMNRIIKNNNAAPLWVVQSDVDSSLNTLRQILVQNLARHMIRKINGECLELFDDSHLETTFTEKEEEWELRENGFHVAALGEVNARIRNYNSIAPYAIRKAYVDLKSELERAYRDSQQLVRDELFSRRRTLLETSVQERGEGSHSVNVTKSVNESSQKRLESSTRLGIWDRLRLWLSGVQPKL